MIDLTIHEGPLTKAIERARERNIIIPTFRQMTNPETIPQKMRESLASVGLWAWNSQWTDGVQNFPDNSGFSALVVVDGYDQTVMLIMLAIGALAGAIGSGIAASRFLDI